MPGKGYKTIAIKEEVLKEIKQKAGGKTVSLYLEEQVVKGGKGKEEEKEIRIGGKEVVSEEVIRQILKEEITGIESDLENFIEVAISKALKGLR